MVDQVEEGVACGCQPGCPVRFSRRRSDRAAAAGLRLVRGPIFRVDREGSIKALRELADDLESGYVAAFEAFLDINGIGRWGRTTAEEAHPMAQGFDVSDERVAAREPDDFETPTGEVRRRR